MMPKDLDSEMAFIFARMHKSSALNRLYAAKIKREGKVQLSRLLNSIARSEEIHANRMLMYIRDKIGEPSEYVERLLQDKKKDASTTYPEIAARLNESGKKKAAEALDQFVRVAKCHRTWLKEVTQERVRDSTEFYVCQVCGYIAADEPPLKCPVCNAVQEKFKIEA